MVYCKLVKEDLQLNAVFNDFEQFQRSALSLKKPVNPFTPTKISNEHQYLFFQT